MILSTELFIFSLFSAFFLLFFRLSLLAHPQNRLAIFSEADAVQHRTPWRIVRSYFSVIGDVSIPAPILKKGVVPRAVYAVQIRGRKNRIRILFPADRKSVV